MNIRNKVVILQPGYIPWLGFFEQMHRCETFVFLDDVQYTRLDWRNRNRIKTATGVRWLTVPVQASGRLGQSINETRIDNSQKWQLKHLRTIEGDYRKATHLHVYFGELEYFYTRTYSHLCPFTVDVTLWLNEKLGLSRKTLMSSSLGIAYSSKQDRLVNMLQALDSNYFYEGKSGRNYIDTSLFARHGIAVEFQDYDHPYYNQLWGKEVGYVSHLSVLDLLFNHGPDSLDILTGKTMIPNDSGIPVRHADEFRSPG